MFTIKFHIIGYFVLTAVAATWMRTSGESQEISILIGVLCGMIFILTDILFQTINFTGRRRMDDVSALNVNFDEINARLKKLEE